MGKITHSIVVYEFILTVTFGGLCLFVATVYYTQQSCMQYIMQFLVHVLEENVRAVPKPLPRQLRSLYQRCWKISAENYRNETK